MSGTPPPPSPRPPGIPIGISDFRKLRAPGIHYVDKTDFVAGVLAAGDEVLLFPRPRRFGKTVNLSTLRCPGEAWP
jgi:Predicted AAA-ATPase